MNFDHIRVIFLEKTENKRTTQIRLNYISLLSTLIDIRPKHMNSPDPGCFKQS